MPTQNYLTVTFIILIMTVPAAHATNGYMSHGYGTTSKGMAGAGSALPRDTLSIFNNPAGLVRLGRRYDAEFELFSPKREYKANADFAPPPPPPFSVPPGTEESENDYFLIPSFGINFPLDDRSTVGLAIAGQGGMNTEYDTATFANFAAPPGTPANPTGAFTATEPTGVDLAQMAFALTYARELDAFARLGITRQSIGITPILAAQRFKARGLQPFKALSASPDKLTDNGYDYSYGGGIRVGWLGSLLNDQLNVGISYQSKLWMTDFDDYEGLFAGGGEFDIPAVLNFGIAFALTPELTVVADYKRIYYGDIDALSNTNDVSFGQIISNPDNRLGGDDGLGFGWEDINVYSVGLQYQVNDNLTLRAGYSDADEPWKDVNTLFNVLAPATVEKHASLGATYKLDKQSRVNLAFTHAFENTIEGTSQFTGPQTGHVRMSQNILQISYSRNIGIQ
ncbi:MAG: transporter [Gammaproteobacteria bacterium]|nr:MAG: transporter [Gammaproteobacteria bacterium]